MEGIKFIESIHLYRPDNAYVTFLSSGIKTKEELFMELSKNLRFPEYFGYNWDALADCLQDLHWIEQMGVVLIHEEILALDRISVNNYLHILIEASENWKEGNEHYFEVVFPAHLESQILQYL